MFTNKLNNNVRRKCRSDEPYYGNHKDCGGQESACKDSTAHISEFKRETTMPTWRIVWNSNWNAKLFANLINTTIEN